MIAAILIASNTIGALPLIIAVGMKTFSNPELASQFAANSNDFSVLGLDPNLFLIFILLPFVAGLAVLVLLAKPLNNRSINMIINGTAKIRWKRFFISAVIWLMLSAIYLLFYQIFSPSNFSLNNTSVSLITLTVISVLLIPFQASFEEVLFRGYLMQGFAAILKNRWFPLVMTSIMFGLMHAFNPEVKEFGFFTMMPHYILFGLIFGVITIMDDGIEAAMGAHTANNIFLCIMLTSKSSALQAPALFEQNTVYPWTEFTGLLFTGFVFIFILSKLLNWKNFSTLFEKIPD